MKRNLCENEGFFGFLKIYFPHSSGYTEPILDLRHREERAGSQMLKGIFIRNMNKKKYVKF